MSQHGGDEAAYRKVGRAILDDLEDRRDVKRPLIRIRESADPKDQEVYRQLELDLGRLAWEATIKQTDWDWRE